MLYQLNAVYALPT